MSEENQTVPAAPAAVKSEMRVGGPVLAIVPRNIDEMWRVSTIISKSGMAPKGIDTPEKVMICLMHGAEVGFTAMAALQSIAPINGRPTIWGDGALGLVQGSGKMEWIKEWTDGVGDAMIAHCHVKRVGDVEVKMASFSVADAKTAGLTGKQGPWTQYRPRMLKMRARSWALRDGFSDVLKGISIREEVEDYAPDTLSATPTPAPQPAAPTVIPRASEMAKAAPTEAVDGESTPVAPTPAPVAVQPAAAAPAHPAPRTAKAAQPATPAAPPQPPANAIRLKEVPTDVKEREGADKRIRYGIFFSVGVVGTFNKDAATKAAQAIKDERQVDVAFTVKQVGTPPKDQRDLVWIEGEVVAQ